MGNHSPARWQPTAPEDGDFTLGQTDTEEFNPDDWPADPGAYRPTFHFRKQYRDYERVLTGDIINDAITGGNCIPALDNCAAFYTTRPGVVYYVIVGWDQTEDNPREQDARVVVTAWPWVFDRDEALDSGRYSTRALTRMQHTNGTLLNADTADEDWLEYYTKGNTTME